MFSVVIPLYNKELSVSNTINTVLNQTFVDFEVIVVNDGSTDNSVDVVANIVDSRIRIINQKNGGVSSARNRGIEEAKYDWIAFLDGDDLWVPNHLETVYRLITKFPQDKVFCTSFVRSEKRNSNQNNSVDDIVIIDDYFEEATRYHFFWTSVVVLHKSVFEEVGVFKEFLSRGEDLDLWSRIGFKYRFVRSTLITAIYNYEAENKATLRKLNLDKSRVYHLSGKDYMISESSRLYYINSVYTTLINLLKQRDIRGFYKLLRKQSSAITYNNLRDFIGLRKNRKK